MAWRLEAAPFHAQYCPTIWFQGEPGSIDLLHFPLYMMVSVAVGGGPPYWASAVMKGRRIAQASEIGVRLVLLRRQEHDTVAGMG